MTADEAAEQLKQDLGEDFLGVLGSNPLLASIGLRLNVDHAHPDSLKCIEHLQEDSRAGGGLQRRGGAEHREQHEQARLAVLGFRHCCLSIIAVALRSTTPSAWPFTASASSIRTMHLVGATRWFIKKPFWGRASGRDPGVRAGDRPAGSGAAAGASLRA
ncbi:MAG: hypothetical protein IPI07_02975 [Flavobacteriales bacterium]|nr:hypothetical protein [Flavobacteriales bacterium]